jgi:hypothetical protein
VALGGPDTATRTKTVWQVKLAGPDESPDEGACDPFPPDWVPQSARSTGRLRARAEAAEVQTNECMVPLGGGYRRLENQLYRVEIHEPGSGADATYKWSRDNGSIVGRLEAIDPKSPSDFSAGELTLSEPGRDTVIGFADAAVIELSDEGRTLRGEPGILLEVDTITGNAIKWKNYTGAAFSLASLDSLPSVRRWEGTAAVDVGQWHELEGGVWIELDGGDFKTGDYWTIPARTSTGAIEWPTEDGTPVFQSRRGIEHRYAPLGYASRGEDGTWSVQSDCRRTFDPLTALATLVYLGGDGQEAKLGETLPQRLEVGVFRGRRPSQGAHIRFSTQDGGVVGPADGLADAGDTFDIDTADDGVADCSWRLAADPGRPSQLVTAVLLDDHGNELAPFVHFSGRLSLADQVTYIPDEACADLADAADVQAAIDVLCKRPTHFVAADIGYTPECAVLKKAKAVNVQAALTELCRNLGAGGAKPDPLTFRLERHALNNTQDPAGVWQFEGGFVFDMSGTRVGSYSSTKRMTTSALEPPLNAGTLTLSILFLGSSPPENVTVQGSHDFSSGNEVGSVSAASSSRAAYIGQPFTRLGDTVTLGSSAGGPG